VEGGSEQAGRLVAWPCRRSDEGGPGGTARPPPVPPPQPLAPAPFPGGGEGGAGGSGRRGAVPFGCGGRLCARLSLAEREGERDGEERV